MNQHPFALSYQSVEDIYEAITRHESIYQYILSYQQLSFEKILVLGKLQKLTGI